MSASNGLISIVIPTLNEAATLPETIPHTFRAAQRSDVEIIVSDCDSRDGTEQVARDCGAIVVRGGSCRATALNRGAAAARGDVLLFLHADSWLPPGFDTSIRRALSSHAIAGGAFDFQFSDHPRAQGLAARCLDLVVLCNRIRYRWTGNFYGDQCIFVRRSIFERVGGFPRVALMEDIAFCQRLRRFGRTAILRPPVRTSPRRFLDHGVIRQFVQDLSLLARENLGMRSIDTWRRYNNWNHRTGGTAGKTEVFTPTGSERADHRVATVVA
jgi:rSAM/selenodomain-associated transferase 2